MAKFPFSDWPVEPLACSVSCTLCWAWGVLVRSLILSWFMLWMQASAEEAGLLWCKVFFRTVARWWDKWGLKLLIAPCCPLGWDVFSVIFSLELPVLIVKSTVLCKTCRFLLGFAWAFDSFWVMLCAASFCWTLWMPAFDCKTEIGCSFSAAFLEVLECVRLKGKGLVHGFSFLALPCRKTPKC